MCLILLAWHAHPQFPLVLAANRDEYYVRASAQATFWREQPAVLGGRDLESMGTWLGITRSGRLAAVTNVREAPAAAAVDAPSRGKLTTDFLCSAMPAAEYAAAVYAAGTAYRGFNLLVADRHELWWTSNRAVGTRRLAAGVYGLSNERLDTPWPKVVSGKQRLAQALESGVGVDGLLALLADSEQPGDAELPDTGVGLERERALSAAHVVSAVYGTRCSSVLIVDADGHAEFAERSFEPHGATGETLTYEFALTP
jgi:uncharacterized protein with NRDE domain